jgi:hypothetical protein
MFSPALLRTSRPSTLCACREPRTVTDGSVASLVCPRASDGGSLGIRGMRLSCAAATAAKQSVALIAEMAWMRMTRAPSLK